MSTDCIDVLVPTRNRPAALAVTLAGLAAQQLGSRHLNLVLSDQSDAACDPYACAEVKAMLRILTLQGHAVQTLRNLPRRGLAHQRAYLLAHAQGEVCVFVDDDVWIEPDLLQRLHDVLREQGCGFVGSAVHGASHANDVRPGQQVVEFWDGPVRPETVRPEDPEWLRHHLHSAANLLHLQKRLGADRRHSRCYKVAWVGGCVAYDVRKLRAAGGFDFWSALPQAHCGEDVLAQLRVMQRFGGCGLFPSGAYHLELPTTVPEREIDAPRVLPLPTMNDVV